MSNIGQKGVQGPGISRGWGSGSKTRSQRRRLILDSDPREEATSGEWLDLTAFSDDTSIGSVAWATTENALVQDNTYANVLLFTGNISHYLKSLGLVKRIPTGTTIGGIQIRVDKYATALVMTDNSVRLVKDGVISGTDQPAVPAYPTTDTDTYVVYGGVSDLWGLTWTPDEVNATDFGAVISTVSSANAIAYIDHIQIAVTFS